MPLALGISAGAAALLAMYALSVTATLGAAAVLRRTALPGPVPALVLGRILTVVGVLGPVVRGGGGAARGRSPSIPPPPAASDADRRTFFS